MDPCFSPPIVNHLANQQSSVIAGFTRNFPDYTHRIMPTGYDLHLHENVSAGTGSGSFAEKDGQELFSIFPAGTGGRTGAGYSTGTATIRKAGSVVTAVGSLPDCPEPADLSVRTTADLPAPAVAGQTNTRLLREILRGKKADDFEEDANEYVVSSPASDCAGDEGSGEDVRSKSAEDDREEEEAGGVIRQTGEPTEELYRVEAISVVGMPRVPSNGTASENSDLSTDSRRKTSKRKQIYPQQVDGAGQAAVGGEPDENVVQKQLNMMQEQIADIQKRFSSTFDKIHTGQPTGQKRKHVGDTAASVNDIDPTTVNGTVPAFRSSGGGDTATLATAGVRRMNDQLAALISTEIQEKISPIVASVINKYLHPVAAAPTTDKDHRLPQQPSHQPAPRHRSKTASPVAIPPARSASPAPLRLRTPAEKPKQPLLVNNNDFSLPGKNFGSIYRGFPVHPFFGNENKLANDFINMSQLTAAALVSGAPTMYSPAGFQQMMRPGFFPAEQTEPMPLVVSQKKKRHKVTDTRITPRGMSRVMQQKEDSQEGKFPHGSPSPMNTMVAFNGNGHPYMTLNHSDFSPFHPGTGMDNGGRFGLATPPFFNRGNMDRRESSTPLGGSAGSPAENDDASMDASEADSTDMSVGGGGRQRTNFSQADSLTYPLSSTLTPMHLRKAKLMFFFTRYPNSATLKTYFPDIKFNKNNTAQLVKWFSNFREYYYIQMEKFAKQALADGVKNADEIEVLKDSELYRALNLHYNRNNHIDVPDAFRDVVEETLREFFKALQCHRDQEPSWKKAIYKVINRMDDAIPDYFRLPHFLEQLE